MIKYIGSKRVLVPLITSVVRSLKGARSAVDLFSGTSRVGHALKKSGFQVIANDLNSYAAVLATCYVQADRDDQLATVTKLVRHMNTIKGEPGYFTDAFCVQSRFFQPKNGARVDAIREWIAREAFEPELEAVLLVALMEAADRIDSTCGLQMAYLKQWAPRAHNDLEVRVPDLVSRARHGKGQAHQREAQDAARTLTGDVAYLDPPYNQHKYLGNYHVWESLVRWDKPEFYGVACKRIDCRERKSSFNSKPRIHDAMRAVVDSIDARHLVVSFNNEGYISRDEMVEMLSSRGEVFVIEREFKRYVGAQIGIYNPDGDKVGKVSHLGNKEFLFIVPERPDDLQLPSEMFRPAQEAFAFDRKPSTPAAAPQRTPARPAALSVNRAALREATTRALREHGPLSSQAAQRITNASAAQLRPVFAALIEEGIIYKTGRRRGTVYHWQNNTNDCADPPTVAVSTGSGPNGCEVGATPPPSKDSVAELSQPLQKAPARPGDQLTLFGK